MGSLIGNAQNVITTTIINIGQPLIPLVEGVIYGSTSCPTPTTSTSSSTSTGGGSGITPVPTNNAAFRCDVLLPITTINTGNPLLTQAGLSMSRCPAVNLKSNTGVDIGLTAFAQYLIEFVLKSFNETLGTNYTTNDCTLKSLINDQNSTCSYLLTIGTVAINCYLQAGNVPRISFKFIEGL